MTSKIKVNILADGGDNSIITSDGAGSFTASSSLASSVQSVGGIQMTPSFEAVRITDQSITDATQTKVQFDVKNFDTDNYYDNTTNYRFTPLVAGKYYVYASIQSEALGDSDLRRTQISIYKNGSRYREIQFLQQTYRARQQNPYVAGIIDMNGTTDYLEIYTYIDDNSGNPVVNGSNSEQNYFGAYKVIGA
jgi:hypothetical protein